ncbi:MAG: radical SAM protein [Oscillospiraceae bacterium]|jgi:radical SAM protein with 4Fe4S-binding SPASM domain|nr:radical SAM protein [Oscillospiraceae bacterium]
MSDAVRPGDANSSGAPDAYEERKRAVEAWNEMQRVIRAHASANRIPYKGTFELTARCSLKCKMCYMRLDQADIAAQGRELTAAEWIRMGELAFEAGTVDLLLTGGEPMLRPDFPEIYTALSDMGFILRVYTNATLVTDEIVALFEERPPQDVEISVYGASRETYARVGGWADGYDRMVAGLDRLRQVVPSIKLKTTIIRDNAADYDAMTQFAHERGLTLSTTSLPMPAIRGARADVRSCRLNLRELLTFHHDHAFEVLNDDCAPPPASRRAGLYCDAGLSSYSVLWHGAMVACMTDADARCVKGYPLEEGFDAAWARLVEFREGKDLPEPCKTCPVYPVCSTCAIHHHAETGSYLRHSEYCCNFYRIRKGLPPITWGADEARGE